MNPTETELGERQTSTLELTITVEGESTSPNEQIVEEVENPDPEIVTGVLPVNGPLVGAKLTICGVSSVAEKQQDRALNKSAPSSVCSLDATMRTMSLCSDRRRRKGCKLDYEYERASRLYGSHFRSSR